MDSRRPQKQVVNECPDCGTLADVTAHEPFTKVTCPSCETPFRARTRFDHFLITEQIGTGGMSRVFSARDSSLERSVALKILNKACSQDQARARQFEKEAEITARISHPNVVRVFTAGRDQGHFYIAMELVSGGSLEGVLRDKGRMKESAALEVAIQAVQGLKAANDAGLIHRDIKPGNILFAEDGTPKIVDFGLAIFAREADGSGEIWATPFYVPLETLKHEPEDFRGDIYSLGATLYHVLTGKPPCKDTSSLEELKELKSKPLHVKPAVHKLSEETCAILERALAVKPADRYASYDEFLDHLRHAQRRLRRGGKGKPWPGRRRRGVALWQWTAAAATVAAGVMLILFLNRKPPQVTATGGGTPLENIDVPAGSENSISGRFLSARNAMLGGDFGKARQFFTELGEAPSTPQPTRGWARFNAGLCALFMNDLAGARSLYASLASDDLSGTEPEITRFFSGGARLLSLDDATPAKRIGDFPPGTVAILGLLAEGLKSWSNGDAATSAVFLNAFQSAEVPAAFPWIEKLKPLAQPYITDAGVIATLPVPDAGGLSEADADALLAKTRETLAKLTQTGPPRDKAAALVETLVASVAMRKARLASTSSGDHTGRVSAEMKQIRDLNGSLAGLGEGFRFAEGAQKLKALPLKTPEALAAQEAHVIAWQKAGEFLEVLARDLARQPVQGTMDHQGTTLNATVSASANLLIFRHAQDAEAKAPIGKISPARLIDLALLARERVVDSDEYYRRSELLYSFALRTGLSATAAALGEDLSLELRAFRVQMALLNNVEAAPFSLGEMPK